MNKSLCADCKFWAASCPFYFDFEEDENGNVIKCTGHQSKNIIKTLFRMIRKK